MLQAKFLPTLKSLLVEPGTPIIHRDISWLQFNERVLAESRAAQNPLLERAKFLSITASNLDEYFMIRVPSLVRQIAALSKPALASDEETRNKLIRMKKIRSSIFESVSKFLAKQTEAHDLLFEELMNIGVRIVRAPAKEDPAYALGLSIFQSQILPNLSPPEKFTSTHPQQLDNLQIAALFKNGFWMKIPKTIPNSFTAKCEETNEHHIFFLDDLLHTHLAHTFGLDTQVGTVKICRDGDFTVDLEEEDTESIPDIVRTGVTTRERGKPSRLLYSGDFSEGMLVQVMRALKVRLDEVMPAPYTVCLNALWSAVNQLPDEIRLKPGLSYQPLVSRIPQNFRETKHVFDELKEQDYLLHHPYDSFDAFVEWIRAACEDPNVAQIEQTIYRMDTLSPVIDLLKSAAAKGKRVRVTIELRARFDELNNLRLADELRKAGVEVAFGFGKLKLHAKVALVTRHENGQDVRYTHLSTGNYNATTSRLYTDLAIITSNVEIGQDARKFFDSVYKGQVPATFKKLVPAPTTLHKIIAGLIDQEINAAREKKPARIVAKVNSLVDEHVIERLYAASAAGVKVDLIVRGACSIVPGVKGLSENIRVISLVDRFLEHSRLYYFESSRTMYLSSADWMPRNFFSRLELAFPVLDERIKKYIETVLIPTYLSDTVRAKELTPQGTWKKRVASGRAPKIRAQFHFEELAKKEYVGTPLDNPPKTDLNSGHGKDIIPDKARTPGQETRE